MGTYWFHGVASWVDVLIIELAYLEALYLGAGEM